MQSEQRKYTQRSTEIKKMVAENEIAGVIIGYAEIEK